MLCGARIVLTADRSSPSELGRVIVEWVEDTEVILRGAPNDLTEDTYHGMCEIYGLDPSELPKRLRRLFLSALAAYIAALGRRGLKVTNGDLVCLYAGILMAAREYEGR